MPTHAEKRRVPYAPDQIFALVADIDAYPQFLPWTAGVRVRSRKPLPIDEGPGEVVEADMIVSFKLFRERFGSRVTLRPQARRIDVAYLDGPFKYLNNHWVFLENEDGSTTIDFFVDFEFKSLILQKLIGVVFNEAMLRVVRAFERRADELYGDNSADAAASQPV